MSADPLAKTIDTLTASAIAGVEPATLRSWRNRVGFFPETRQPGKIKHQFFSLLDVCKIRQVQVLTEHGLPVAHAVTFVQDHLGGHLFALILRRQGVIAADTALTQYVGFERGGVTTGRALVAEEGKPASEWREADVADLPPPRVTFHVLPGGNSIASTMPHTTGVLTVVDLDRIVAHVLDALK
jgi:DNA-binding transcriptional MerR regulator